MSKNKLLDFFIVEVIENQFRAYRSCFFFLLIIIHDINQYSPDNATKNQNRQVMSLYNNSDRFDIRIQRCPL